MDFCLRHAQSSRRTTRLVCKLDDVDLDSVLLPVSVQRRIIALFTKLEELNDVVLKLQLHSCTNRQARAYFGSVLDVFPTVEVWVSQSARIVHSSVFELVVVKIQDAREQVLLRLRSVQFVICC